MLLCCPQCLQEYDGPATRCVECKVDLVPKDSVRIDERARGAAVSDAELAAHLELVHAADPASDDEPAAPSRPPRSLLRPPVADLPAGITRTLLMRELTVILLVVWLPAFAFSFWLRAHPEPIELSDELLWLVTFAGELALLAFLVWRNGERWQSLGLRRTRWWAELAWGALAYACCSIAASSIGDLMYLIGLTPRGYWQYSDQFLASYKWTLPFYLLVGAAYEEVIYRGYLPTRLEQLGVPPWLAILSSSLLFAATHPYNLGALAETFAFGVALGLFQHWGQSLPRLILAHWVYNMVVILA